MNSTKQDYQNIQKKIKGRYEAFKEHEEAREYNGCEYLFNGKRVILRRAKITPKREGRFVTLWKRVKGVTTPYSLNDKIDQLIIIYPLEVGDRYIIYSCDDLDRLGIITGKSRGKRGFRVYS